MFPGVGLYACPIAGQATERLVQVPLLGDRPNVCSELKAVDNFISRLWLPDFIFDTSGAGGGGSGWCVAGCCRAVQVARTCRGEWR
jgi:hypothetical protein